MTVSILARAEKGLKNLPKVDQFAISEKLRSFGTSENIHGEEKLTGHKNLFRVRVGDYRVVYFKNSSSIQVILISHRKDVYLLLNRLIR